MKRRSCARRAGCLLCVCALAARRLRPCVCVWWPRPGLLVGGCLVKRDRGPSCKHPPAFADMAASRKPASNINSPGPALQAAAFSRQGRGFHMIDRNRSYATTGFALILQESRFRRAHSGLGFCPRLQENFFFRIDLLRFGFLPFLKQPRFAVDSDFSGPTLTYRTGCPLFP